MLRESGLRPVGRVGLARQVEAMPRAENTGTDTSRVSGERPSVSFCCRESESRVGQHLGPSRRDVGQFLLQVPTGGWQVRKTGALSFERKMVLNKIRLHKAERPYWLCLVIHSLGSIPPRREKGAPRNCTKWKTYRQKRGTRQLHW